jgi:uncharacterized protein DUF3800
MPYYNYYIDETGNRNPDQKPDLHRERRDWFGIGGILVKGEDIQACKDRRQVFVDKWEIRSPLHMTDILGNHKKFSWLGRLPEERRHKFWGEYKTLLAGMPGIGLSCIIDRPGYVARGYLRDNPDRWLLCRSAFDISVERAAKIARRDGRKLNVVFEQDHGINHIIKGYFANLKSNGLGFDAGRSGKYGPLTQMEFAETLSTIEYKPKINSMLQIADSYLYAMARHPYDKRFDVYCRLRDAHKTANTFLSTEEVPSMGIKHYCFELHNARNK